MPSNNVLVNHTLSFEVNDSRMDELTEWLRLNSWNTKDLSKVEEPTEFCRNLEKSSNR
jgi:hypothetical protein